MNFLKRTLKYLILFVEAIIASPEWAARHADAMGVEFGPKTSGWAAVLSLFLRPTVMIFFFFAVMCLLIGIANSIQFALTIL